MLRIIFYLAIAILDQIGDDGPPEGVEDFSGHECTIVAVANDAVLIRERYHGCVGEFSSEKNK